MTKLYRFFNDESGVTAIEYGLIAAGIGIAIVLVVGQVGDALVTLFDKRRSRPLRSVSTGNDRAVVSPKVSGRLRSRQRVWRLSFATRRFVSRHLPAHVTVCFGSSES